jgi:ankyrin repeat protein
MKRIFRLLALVALLSGFAGFANAGVYDDMIVAIRNDDTVKVTALLERGMDVNTADQNGTTLTMYAARSGNEKLLEYLLTHRANKLIKNNFGDTAISLSALEGHIECVKMLASVGAEINPENGWTPLNYAAFNGHTDVAAFLIEQGARIDARAPNGMTSLMLAARNGHLPLVHLLLDHHADASLKTADGKTAFDIAAAANQRQVAAMLNGKSLQPRMY